MNEAGKYKRREREYIIIVIDQVLYVFGMQNIQTSIWCRRIGMLQVDTNTIPTRS